MSNQATSWKVYKTYPREAQTHTPKHTRVHTHTEFSRKEQSPFLLCVQHHPLWHSRYNNSSQCFRALFCLQNNEISRHKHCKVQEPFINKQSYESQVHKNKLIYFKNKFFSSDNFWRRVDSPTHCHWKTVYWFLKSLVFPEAGINLKGNFCVYTPEHLWKLVVPTTTLTQVKDCTLIHVKKVTQKIILLICKSLMWKLIIIDIKRIMWER